MNYSSHGGSRRDGVSRLQTKLALANDTNAAQPIASPDGVESSKYAESVGFEQLSSGFIWLGKYLGQICLNQQATTKLASSVEIIFLN